MNAPLHSVEPTLQKLSRLIESFTRTVVDIYIGIFSAIGSGFLILFGVMFVIVGLALPIQEPSGFSASLVIVPVGLAWVFSRKMRRLTWIFLGLLVTWMIILTGTLLPFLDIEERQPLPIQIALVFAYLVPPIIATAIALKYKTKC